MSHLTRGAWIEIIFAIFFYLHFFCRTSHEVRGLKYIVQVPPFPNLTCRTSHEVRGLKYFFFSHFPPIFRSHLTRGAWIEILNAIAEKWLDVLSHLTRGAWIEILSYLLFPKCT